MLQSQGIAFFPQSLLALPGVQFSFPAFAIGHTMLPTQTGVTSVP